MNTTNPAFTLNKHGLVVTELHRNLPPSALYEHAIRHEKDASIAENGALVAYSGVKTGRSQPRGQGTVILGTEYGGEMKKGVL